MAQFINERDVAAANVGFEALQMIIDMLVKKGALDAAEVHGMWQAIAERHDQLAKGGNPLRRSVEEAAVKVATTLATKSALASG